MQKMFDDEKLSSSFVFFSPSFATYLQPYGCSEELRVKSDFLTEKKILEKALIIFLFIYILML